MRSPSLEDLSLRHVGRPALLLAQLHRLSSSVLRDGLFPRVRSPVRTLCVPSERPPTHDTHSVVVTFSVFCCLNAGTSRMNELLILHRARQPAIVTDVAAICQMISCKACAPDFHAMKCCLLCRTVVAPQHLTFHLLERGPRAMQARSSYYARVSQCYAGACMSKAD